ncbi:hypothetical protein POM88_034474 [Heracleum sosnowskyi]|uniref:Uncharacterized protein n=1 Tax=Heracleum sosnowskyi TaxID=360622 RepID=A0AAD8HLH3_9APIA|nr:hypothetical protein POM88_034474 [Heracleum sosnowskyi]
MTCLISLSCIRLWTCFCFRLIERCNIPMVAIATFPTGMALAIEKKTQSKKLKRADVVVFSISTAIIMHCYAMERDVFRSKYLNVLDWVFGVPLPLDEATPRKGR